MKRFLISSEIFFSEVKRKSQNVGNDSNTPLCRRSDHKSSFMIMASTLSSTLKVVRNFPCRLKFSSFRYAKMSDICATMASYEKLLPSSLKIFNRFVGMFFVLFQNADEVWLASYFYWTIFQNRETLWFLFIFTTSTYKATR